jgi:hypothetical protein
MRRIGLTLALLLLLTVGSGFAGSDLISGPVWGIWAAGSVCIVADYAYVPAGKSLLVEEGVEIVFLTDAAFDIYGIFDAIGTSDQPIIVTAPNNWGGFYFRGDRDSRTDTLRYVIAGQDGGMPRHVVRSQGHSLVVSSCIFAAAQSCLEVSNAHLWADDNFFLATGLFSRTVKLESLVPVSDFPPGTAPQNCLTNSIVTAEVPLTTVSPFDWRFTTALDVESSNETVVSDNTFSVLAPGYACGVFYGEAEGTSPVGARIQHCVVAVRSFNVQARGIVNAHEGDLEIRQCNIDVGGGQYSPIGVSASNRAQSYVNSCYIGLTVGGRFCLAELGANVTVMYTDLWLSTPTLASPGGDLPPYESKLDVESGVVYGAGVFREDPQFVRGCPWGEWVSHEAVRSYYSLLPTSPCIDRGDMALGLDPDNTRPDVGCFYFSQASSVPERPAVPAPVSVLLAPYPNPFNSSAAISFVLQHAGELRVTAFDILGRPVAELAAGRYAAGEHTVSFQARGWASGVYFVTLDFEGVRSGTQKLLLVR